MLIVATKLQKIAKALKAIPATVADTLNDNKGLVKSITQEQLLRGERADNRKLPKYVKDSEHLKTKNSPKKAPGGIMNLRDTGKFYRSIITNATKKELTFKSTDPKYPILNLRFGDNKGILAWNENTIRNLKKTELNDIIIKAIKDELQA